LTKKEQLKIKELCLKIIMDLGLRENDDFPYDEKIRRRRVSDINITVFSAWNEFPPF
jgi:hypothetical protein